MKQLKTIIINLLLLSGFLGYSYYNYDNRRKAVDAVEEYGKENNLTQIWHFREMHFNVFDWLIEDKSQFNFIYVNEYMMEKKGNHNYWVQFSSFKDPQKLETMTNFTLERRNDKFKIIINDLFWLPTKQDSLNIKEIKGTVFEIVDNWIKNKTNRQN